MFIIEHCPPSKQAPFSSNQLWQLAGDHHRQVCRLLSFTQKRRWENFLDSHPRLQLLSPARVCDSALIVCLFRASGGARVYKLYKVNWTVGQLHLQSYGEAITHARWWLSSAEAFGSLASCLHLFSVAMMNAMTESNLGEEMLYLSLHFQIIVHHQGNSGQ